MRRRRKSHVVQLQEQKQSCLHQDLQNNDDSDIHPVMTSTPEGISTKHTSLSCFLCFQVLACALCEGNRTQREEFRVFVTNFCRERLCFSILCYEVTTNTSELWFYHFGFSSETLDLSQQQNLSPCILTVHGKQEEEILQMDRFPIRELASKGASLRAEYLSKSKELHNLEKQLQQLKNKVNFANLEFFCETLWKLISQNLFRFSLPVHA